MLIYPPFWLQTSCILLLLEKGQFLKVHILTKIPPFETAYFPKEIMSTVKELFIIPHQMGVTVQLSIKNWS